MGMGALRVAGDSDVPVAVAVKALLGGLDVNVGHLTRSGFVLRQEAEPVGHHDRAVDE